MKLVVLFLLTLVCTVFCYQDRNHQFFNNRRINNTNVYPRFFPEIAALGSGDLLGRSFSEAILPKLSPILSKIGEYLLNFDFLSIIKAFSPLRIIDFFQNIVQGIRKLFEGLRIVFSASVTIDNETKKFEKTLVEPTSIFHLLGDNKKRWAWTDSDSDDSPSYFNMRKGNLDVNEETNDADRQNRIISYLKKADEFLESLKRNIGLAESDRGKRNALDNNFKAVLSTALNRLFMKGI